MRYIKKCRVLQQQFVWPMLHTQTDKGKKKQNKLFLLVTECVGFCFVDKKYIFYRARIQPKVSQYQDYFRVKKYYISYDCSLSQTIKSNNDLSLYSETDQSGKDCYNKQLLLHIKQSTEILSKVSENKDKKEEKKCCVKQK